MTVNRPALDLSSCTIFSYSVKELPRCARACASRPGGVLSNQVNGYSCGRAGALFCSPGKRDTSFLDLNCNSARSQSLCTPMAQEACPAQLGPPLLDLLARRRDRTGHQARAEPLYKRTGQK